MNERVSQQVGDWIGFIHESTGEWKKRWMARWMDRQKDNGIKQITKQFAYYRRTHIAWSCQAASHCLQVPPFRTKIRSLSSSNYVVSRNKPQNSHPSTVRPNVYHELLITPYPMSTSVVFVVVRLRGMILLAWSSNEWRINIISSVYETDDNDAYVFIADRIALKGLLS